MFSIHPVQALRIAIVATVVAVPTIAQATNGYTMHGYGTAQRGMAGAGSALPMDSMIVYSNPAGLTRLGKRFDLEVSLFSPSDRGYTANGDFSPSPSVPYIEPGTYKSKNDWFVIPSLGMNWRLSDQSALALTMAGSGGMNTEYSNAVFENFAVNESLAASTPTGINLQQALIALSYARDISPHHTIAISPIFAVQTLAVKGLQPFNAFSESPGKVTNNGTDISYGGGVRVGWLGSFADDRINLGVSYQTKLWMSEFDDYKGLLAEQGSFDIPAQLNVGIAFKPMSALSIALDWQRIYYGDIASLNNGNSAAPNSPDTLLGADNGLGFGWETIDVYKMGINYDFDEKLAFRAGYSHADPVFKGADALFNIIAPATVTEHISIGFSYKISEVHGVTFAYTRALDSKIKGKNEAFTGSQTGSLFLEQNIVDLGYTYNF